MQNCRLRQTNGRSELIYKIHERVCDEAQVQVRSTEPKQKRDSKNGIGRPGQKWDSKNDIRKNGIRKNGIRLSSRSGLTREKLYHLCLCFVVATPELQARVCMPRVDVPDLFLFIAKMAIICRKMWKKWVIL
jgi:hypothetical protein